MAGNAYLVANGYLGFIKEVTRGTTPSSGTVFYVPVTTPQVSPMQTFLDDGALRGSPVALYDAVQGVRHDEFDHKSFLYADTFPVYVSALLGGTDTVTTTSSSYSHSQPLLNAASTGSQPPSYSICNFDGANWFTLANSQGASLAISAGADAAAEATLKWISNPYTSATSAPTPFTSLSTSTEHLIPSWNSTITLAGSPITYVESLDLLIDRKTAPIFTDGTQAPYSNFAGPIEVTGKFTCVVASNADPFSTGTGGYALTRTPQTLTIALTDPNDVHSAINDSITFQMSQVQFENVKRTQGKQYLSLDVEFKAEANSTDAASGFSPIKIITVNGISAAF